MRARIPCVARKHRPARPSAAADAINQIDIDHQHYDQPGKVLRPMASGEKVQATLSDRNRRRHLSPSFDFYEAASVGARYDNAGDSKNANSSECGRRAG